jgi:hypothetical protein
MTGIVSIDGTTGKLLGISGASGNLGWLAKDCGCA